MDLFPGQKTVDTKKCKRTAEYGFSCLGGKDLEEYEREKQEVDWLIHQFWVALGMCIFSWDPVSPTWQWNGKGLDPSNCAPPESLRCPGLQVKEDGWDLRNPPQPRRAWLAGGV